MKCIVYVTVFIWKISDEQEKPQVFRLVTMANKSRLVGHEISSMVSAEYIFFYDNDSDEATIFFAG